MYYVCMYVCTYALIALHCDVVVLVAFCFVPLLYYTTAHDEVFLAVYERSKREPSMTQTLWAFRSRITLENLNRAFNSLPDAKTLHPLLHMFLHEVSYNCCRCRRESRDSLLCAEMITKWTSVKRMNIADNRLIEVDISASRGLLQQVLQPSSTVLHN